MLMHLWLMIHVPSWQTLIILRREMWLAHDFGDLLFFCNLHALRGTFTCRLNRSSSGTRNRNADFALATQTMTDNNKLALILWDAVAAGEPHASAPSS